jgi:hypothetical protein
MAHRCRLFGERPKGALGGDSMIKPIKLMVAVAFVGSGAGMLETACSSDSSTPTTNATASAVTGAADSHCKDVVVVNPAVCHAQPAAGDGGAGKGDFGATMFDNEGDDDDCKYHVKWSAAPGSGGVNFTVTVTTKKDNAPVSGAPVDIEAFLDETHPPPNTNPSTKETSPGTYTVGPIGFDQSGKWTVRFHIHDDCNDSEQSPHGHAAFFVQVDVK